LHLEDDPPAVLMPFPAGGPGRDRRLDQHGRVGISPQPGRKLAVEYLDRPPLGHTPTICAHGHGRILTMMGRAITASRRLPPSAGLIALASRRQLHGTSLTPPAACT